MSTIRAAFYEKNVPGWERVLRLTAAAGMTGWAVYALSAPWSYLVAAGAIGFAVTGLVGFCPACAMVGRKL